MLRTNTGRRAPPTSTRRDRGSSPGGEDLIVRLDRMRAVIHLLPYHRQPRPPLPPMHRTLPRDPLAGRSRIHALKNVEPVFPVCCGVGGLPTHTLFLTDRTPSTSSRSRPWGRNSSVGDAGRSGSQEEGCGRGNERTRRGALGPPWRGAKMRRERGTPSLFTGGQGAMRRIPVATLRSDPKT